MWKNKYLYLFCGFLLLAHSNHAKACETGNNKTSIVTKDGLGRLILVWITSDMEKKVMISIDRGPSTTISLPNQVCAYPVCECSSEGDIIVAWFEIDPNKENSLYYTALPYGKSWTEPVCLTNGEESIIPKTHTLEIINKDEVSVFWESITFSKSSKDPKITCFKRELRSVSGTIDFFNEATTELLLNQSND